MSDETQSTPTNAKAQAELQRLLGAHSLNEIRRLENEIDAWVTQEVSVSPAGVPDFWDECNTSSRLAEHLVRAGWRKAAAP